MFPNLPSFVVVPANNRMYEVYFANEIEEAIISCGVKVVKRPSTKRITTENSIGGLEGNRVRDPDASVTSVREADAKRVESYWEYESEVSTCGISIALTIRSLDPSGAAKI